ncbi:unnamed protein product, partial [marine sediment metagenome]
MTRILIYLTAYINIYISLMDRGSQSASPER